ncbi:MAG: hypothetical protein RL557_1058 [archaeon]|jgi:hypothetical protein
MTEQLTDIILYHGSLNELNERTNGQYTFAQDSSFVSLPGKYQSVERMEHEIKRQLAKKDYHGLVNRRTTAVSEDGRAWVSGFIEGTPIVRVNIRKSRIFDS